MVGRLLLAISPLAGFGPASLALAARPASTQAPVCACVPTTAAMSAGFTLAGADRLGAGYPHLPRMGVDGAFVPPVLLKAIAWVESGWEQIDPSSGLPLISPDFGYGTMQITSGMAGAFGDPHGSLPLAVQARIGGDYLYNIAYGARMLAQNLMSLPAINHRDPTSIEDWYYAVWAYNGWGWSNNPNNPRFTRQGNPADEPWAFPYQERVYYLVQHPPLDETGRPLWTPMKVSLPPAGSIGGNPGPLHLEREHQEIPPVYGATYDTPPGLAAMTASSTAQVTVTVYNSGGSAWMVDQEALMYHWVRPGHRSSPRYNPHLGGIDVYDSVNLLPLPGSVPPTGSASMTVPLVAPKATGRLALEWDMVSRDAGLFSYNGAPTGYQTVDVTSDQVAPYQPPGPPVTYTGNHAFIVRYTTAPVPRMLAPGQAYSESILLFNPGGTTWDSGYHLQLTAATLSRPLGVSPLPLGRTLVLTISGTAPSEPGRYVYKWRLATAAGRLFGHVIKVKFRVSA